MRLWLRLTPLWRPRRVTPRPVGPAIYALTPKLRAVIALWRFKVASGASAIGLEQCGYGQWLASKV